MSEENTALDRIAGIPRWIKVVGYLAPYALAVVVWVFNLGWGARDFEGLPARVATNEERIEEIERVQRSQVLVVDTTRQTLDRGIRSIERIGGQMDALSEQIGRILCNYNAQVRRDRGEYVSPFECERPDGG